MASRSPACSASRSGSKRVPRERRAHTRVRDVMEPLHDDLTVSPSASCWEARARLTRNGVGRLVVLQAGWLVGYLSVRDVVPLLTLQVAGGADGRAARPPRSPESPDSIDRAA